MRPSWIWIGDKPAILGHEGTEEEMQRPIHRAPDKTSIPLAFKWLLTRSTDKEWEQCVRAFNGAGESASVIESAEFGCSIHQ
jgi:hypothetical protein